MLTQIVVDLCMWVHHSTNVHFLVTSDNNLCYAMTLGFIRKLITKWNILASDLANFSTVLVNQAELVSGNIYKYMTTGIKKYSISSLLYPRVQWLHDAYLTHSTHTHQIFPLVFILFSLISSVMHCCDYLVLVRGGSTAR